MGSTTWLDIRASFESPVVEESSETGLRDGRVFWEFESMDLADPFGILSVRFDLRSLRLILSLILYLALYIASLTSPRYSFQLPILPVMALLHLL